MAALAGAAGSRDLPMLRVGGMQLFRAEVTGPTRAPNSAAHHETAKALWKVYLGLNLLCALAYWAADEPVRRHLPPCPRSPRRVFHPRRGLRLLEQSDGGVVATGFMLVGGINFGLHYWRAAPARPIPRRHGAALSCCSSPSGAAVTLALWSGARIPPQARRSATRSSVGINITTTDSPRTTSACGRHSRRCCWSWWLSSVAPAARPRAA